MLDVETVTRGQPVPEQSGRLTFVAADLVFLERQGVRTFGDFVRRDDGAIGWFRNGWMLPKVDS